MTSVAIVGPGRLGLALAAAFEQSGEVDQVIIFGRHREAPDHPVVRGPRVRYVHGLERLPGECQAVFLTVPDEAVPEVAHALAGQGEAPPGCAALHVSGILPTDVMEPLHREGYGVGSFYPLVVLTDPARGASRFVGSWAAVTAAPETFRRIQRLADAIGIDGAVDYKADNLGAQLDAIGGVDVYFDNVGGPMLDQVLTRMNHYGRIAVCGLVSDYSSGTRTSPQEFDQVLMRRLRIEGFFSPDFMDQGERLTARLKQWVDTGELTMPYDVTKGLENTLAAYQKLFTGGNIGKVIVELDA